MSAVVAYIVGKPKVLEMARDIAHKSLEEYRRALDDSNRFLAQSREDVSRLEAMVKVLKDQELRAERMMSEMTRLLLIAERHGKAMEAEIRRLGGNIPDKDSF